MTSSTVSPQPLVSVTLTRDELALVLKLLKVTDLPGLDQDPLAGLTEQQQALSLVYGERSLRARDLARLDQDGGLLVHAAVLSAVGVCAYPQQSVHAYRFGSDGSTATLFAHRRDNVLVSHAIPEAAIHELSILSGVQGLVEQLIDFCGCRDGTFPPVRPFAITGGSLAEARQLASEGQRGAVLELLLRDGIDHEAAEQFAAAIAGEHQLSVLYLLWHQQRRDVVSEVSVLKSDDGVWVIPGSHSGEATQLYSLQPIDRSGLQTLIAGLLSASAPLEQGSAGEAS